MPKTSPVERRLKVPRSKASGLLKTAIERCRKHLRSELPFEEAKEAYYSLEEFAREVVTSIVSDPEAADELRAYFYMGPQSTKDIDESVRTIDRKLNSWLDRLELLPAPDEADATKPLHRTPLQSAGTEHVLARLEAIFTRFPAAIATLRTRRSPRPPLLISDEYDLQYLVFFALKLDFDDVRPEDHAPIASGASSRLDFLLHAEEVVVETKQTREGLADKELGNELIIDISRYKSHPRCRTLVCFVYDPDRRIKNPAGLKRDLSTPAIEVKRIRGLG